MFGQPRSLRSLAWLALALGSAAPAIVWRQLLDEPPPLWLPVSQAVVLAAWLPVLGRVPRWRPLRGFVLVLVAMELGLAIVTLGRELPPYAEWARGAADYETVFVSAFLMLVPAALMVVVAAAGGLGRRELFLRRGDLAAPSRIPGTERRVSWLRLGPLLVAAATVLLVVELASAKDPDVDRLGKAAALLPLALVFGAVNALGEEVRFRCVLLARLCPVVGADSAIWMTSLLFGLAHWYGGNPSGPTGVAMTTVFGLALAKSILETRGLFWAWAMHAAADVVIFTLLVLAMS